MIILSTKIKLNLKDVTYLFNQQQLKHLPKSTSLYREIKYLQMISKKRCRYIKPVPYEIYPLAKLYYASAHSHKKIVYLPAIDFKLLHFYFYFQNNRNKSIFLEGWMTGNLEHSQHLHHNLAVYFSIVLLFFMGPKLLFFKFYSSWYLFLKKL